MKINQGSITASLAVLLAVFAWAQAPPRHKVRVYVTDSKSWEITGGIGASEEGGIGGIHGGARPQTAEIIKTFGKRCPDLTVTLNRDNADYIVLLEHEGGKDLIRRDNKVAVSDREGDVLYSGSTRLLGNAVKEACNAIRRHLEQSAGAR